MLESQINNYIDKYYANEFEKNKNVFLEKKKLRELKIKNKDGNNILKLLEYLSKDYVVIDWTDKESCCYEYKILLHKNQKILDDDIELQKELKGLRYDLRIFISVLAPYFYMFIDETSYDENNNLWHFNMKKDLEKEYLNEDINLLIKNISIELKNKGYIQLFYKDVVRRVSHIETEYKYTNMVNVFDCLFTDLVTII